jgi:S1-C subfamily serine protease
VGFRTLASKTVPTNLEMWGEIQDRFSEEWSKRTFCSAVAISKTKAVTAGHCIQAIERSSNETTKIGSVKDGIFLCDVDGNEYVAKVLYWKFEEGKTPEEGRDYALVELVKGEFTHYAPIGNSDDLAVGDVIVIVGNSFGELKHSFSVGYLSYKMRKLAVGEFNQTDAISAGGNSGGGVFNEAGELVGILVRGGGGISLFVPINLVLEQMHNDSAKPE